MKCSVQQLKKRSDSGQPIFTLFILFMVSDSSILEINQHFMSKNKAKTFSPHTKFVFNKVKSSVVLLNRSDWLQEKQSLLIKWHLDI